MKRFALVFALSLGMISCSDKSSSSDSSDESSSSDTTAERELITIEDYTDATVDLFEELADELEATTPANSAKQSKKIMPIVLRMGIIQEEAEAKFGKARWKAVGKSSKVLSRTAPAVFRIKTWSDENVVALKNGEFKFPSPVTKMIKHFAALN